MEDRREESSESNFLSNIHAKARGPPAGHFKQIIETFEPLDTIFNEIDLLEEDPPHQDVAMRNARVMEKLCCKYRGYFSFGRHEVSKLGLTSAKHLWCIC